MDATDELTSLRARLAQVEQERDEARRRIVVDRDADLLIELRSWLDAQTITSDNIGDLRRSLFVPWGSQWNGWVRDETAERENRVLSARSQVPVTRPKSSWELRAKAAESRVSHLEQAQARLIAACRYWSEKKLALDAVRPEFTNDQLRKLNAAEGRLLSAIYEVDEGKADPARILKAEGSQATGSATEALTRLRTALETRIAEMHAVAIAAGQASVEGPDDALTHAAAAEAERAQRWADDLAAILAGTAEKG